MMLWVWGLCLFVRLSKWITIWRQMEHVPFGAEWKKEIDAPKMWILCTSSRGWLKTGWKSVYFSQKQCNSCMKPWQRCGGRTWLCPWCEKSPIFPTFLFKISYFFCGNHRTKAVWAVWWKHFSTRHVMWYFSTDILKFFLTTKRGGADDAVRDDWSKNSGNRKPNSLLGSMGFI